MSRPVAYQEAFLEYISEFRELFKICNFSRKQRKQYFRKIKGIRDNEDGWTSIFPESQLSYDLHVIKWFDRDYPTKGVKAYKQFWNIPRNLGWRRQYLDKILNNNYYGDDPLIKKANLELADKVDEMFPDLDEEDEFD